MKWLGFSILIGAVVLILGLTWGNFASACDRLPPRSMLVGGYGSDMAAALSQSFANPGFGGDIVVALKSVVAERPVTAAQPDPVVPAVPLPAAGWLLLSAVAALAIYRRKA